jgi:Fe2+ transport system protein FeoA
MTEIPIRLCDLREGGCARFHEAHLDDDARHLLQTLGLIKSTPVRLCKSGEPCIVQVRSTRIGLSYAVARHIFVIPESATV